MKFTGERYMPDEFNKSDNISEIHLNRYDFAQSYVRAKSVIDIACGEGYGSDQLAKISNKVVGIDINPETIEHAKSKYKKNNLSFCVGDVENISTPNESVDVVISFETIEHVKHKKQEKFLQEAYRVLKPGGTFIVSTPDKDVTGEGHNEFHVCEMSKAQFLRMLSKNFKIIGLYGQDIKPYGNSFSLLIAKLLHKLVKLDKFKIRHKIFPKKLRLNIDNSIGNSAVNKNLVRKESFIPTKINDNETASYLIAVCRK